MRKIIKYSWDKMGEFIERKNRFLGIVKVEGKLLEVHIHDSGRLGEILYKGNTVFIKAKPIIIEYKDGWLYYKGEIPLCKKEVEE